MLDLISRALEWIYFALGIVFLICGISLGIMAAIVLLGEVLNITTPQDLIEFFRPDPAPLQPFDGPTKGTPFEYRFREA